jgi:hypothetical protein
MRGSNFSLTRATNRELPRIMQYRHKIRPTVKESSENKRLPIKFSSGDGGFDF